MTTYRLHNDIFSYQYVKVDFKLMRRQMKDLKIGFAHKNETLLDRIQDEWQPVPVELLSESKGTQKPDISVWNACLVMSDAARAALEPILKDDGEFLELEDSYHLYNSLCSVGGEIVDDAHSQFEIEFEDSPPIPKKLILKEGKLPKSALFKPGFASNTFFICTDKLKNTVEQHELSGLLFDQDLAQMFPREK